MSTPIKGLGTTLPIPPKPKSKYNVKSVIDTNWRKKPATDKGGTSGPGGSDGDVASRKNSDNNSGVFDDDFLTTNVNEYGSDIRVDGKIASKKSLRKLADRYAEIKRKKDSISWRSIVKNAIDLQKGKIPLLLAVEAGNQSMVRELLSSQTPEQLKVSGYFLWFLKEEEFFTIDLSNTHEEEEEVEGLDTRMFVYFYPGYNCFTSLLFMCSCGIYSGIRQTPSCCYFGRP